MQLVKASRKKVFLRLNISAPSGAGKTMSALLMAYGLVGDWTKIAVIDTENGSASLYEHLGEFNAIDMVPPFTPEKYIQAIDLCIRSGMQCVIVDSSSHEWSGPGGCIEINERLAQAKYRGNTWSAWNETTPRHDSFVSSVLQAKCHMITCTRSKMETVMGEDKKVKKMGMKDIQREGWEYDLTISLNIDRDTHTAIASKDRTNLFEGKDPFIITPETGKMIKAWCELGIEPPIVDTRKPVTDAAIEKAVDRITKGEQELLSKMKETYMLTDDQIAKLTKAYDAVSKTVLKTDRERSIDTIGKELQTLENTETLFR